MATTNYNLYLFEGTSVFNPLTEINPNMETIDATMKTNAELASAANSLANTANEKAITAENSFNEFVESQNETTLGALIVSMGTYLSKYSPVFNNNTVTARKAKIGNSQLVAVYGQCAISYTGSPTASELLNMGGLVLQNLAQTFNISSGVRTFHNVAMYRYYGTNGANIYPLDMIVSADRTYLGVLTPNAYTPATNSSVYIDMQALLLV